LKGRIWNKTTRRIAVFAGAVVITLFVVLLSSSYVAKNTDLVKVVVALEDIQPYQKINERVTYSEKVRSEVPEDAITDMSELAEEPWFANEIGYYKGESIRKSGITTSENSKYGAVLKLEKGKSLIGVKVDQAQSAGDYIKPGVLVDAIVYIKNEFETKTIGPKDDPDLAGLLVYERQNAEGTEPGADGRSLIPSIAILETSSEEVKKKLVTYQEEGKIYLSPSGVKNAD